MSQSHEELSIKGCFNINLFQYQDLRGTFTRVYRAEDGFPKGFSFRELRNIYASDNLKTGTLRGFHRQGKPFEEAKVLTCTKGKAFHVILRKIDNQLYLCTNMLSEKEGNATLVPSDCFSAFLTLEESTNLIYLTDQDFTPGKAEAIRWNDPLLPYIDWPIQPLSISEKDQNIALL